MANTTNYNWETPDDTDLVKDGAAAIRTLGSSVDTTTKALNPSTTLGDIEYRSATANTNTRLPIGTTGQILSVVAGVPAWVANDVGDITEIAAGTGISGGGTSGSVTITNDMATTITAAGDIVVGTGSGTYDNLPIGTTNQVLTADTTVSPYKVKWATPAGGGGKVLQVLQDDLVGAITSTSASYADTGLSQAITPSSATSKVLIIATMNSCAKGGANTQLGLRLLRDSTTISNASDGTGSNAGSGFHNWGTNSIVYLDSPATTASTTYKIQFANKAGSGNVYINDYQAANDCVSTITVMEIGA